MAKVLVPLADGFEEIEAVTVVDVLRRGGVEVVTASIHDRLEVRGAHGMRVAADRQFDEAQRDSCDAIVLPGGGGCAETFKLFKPLHEHLLRQHDEKRLICAICAAPTVLEVAGVLDEGIEVTCYPSCRDELNRPWTPAPVVHDGTVITGQAPGTATLFALVVLQALAGEQVARKVAQGMVTDVLD